MIEILLSGYALGAFIAALITVFMVCCQELDADEALAITALWPLFIIRMLVTGAFKVFVG